MILVDIEPYKGKVIANHLYCGVTKLIEIDALEEVEAIPIPKGATNGEMLKAVFPKKLFDRIDVDWFGEDWWNSPYKEK